MQLYQQSKNHESEDNDLGNQLKLERLLVALNASNYTFRWIWKSF